MKRLILALALVLAVPAGALTITGVGAHTVPDNCGFTIQGASYGWVGIQLLNDTNRADLWAAPGTYYPLRLAEVTLFAGGPAAVDVDTSQQCGFTRSFNIEDQCEVDPNRPEAADPEQVAPGPDLPVNVGFYAGYQTDFELDVIGFEQDDYTHWTTARPQPAEWWPGGVRRCRDVAGYFLTAVAP